MRWNVTFQMYTLVFLATVVLIPLVPVFDGVELYILTSRPVSYRISADEILHCVGNVFNSSVTDISSTTLHRQQDNYLQTEHLGVKYFHTLQLLKPFDSADLVRTVCPERVHHRSVTCANRKNSLDEIESCWKNLWLVGISLDVWTPIHDVKSIPCYCEGRRQ
jgi:hypothetical protein